MLVCRRIVQSCARGSSPEEMNMKLMDKYRYALHSVHTANDGTHPYEDEIVADAMEEPDDYAHELTDDE